MAMPDIFKESFERYKVAASSDADLLANMRQRWTAASGFTIDTGGGLGTGRAECLNGVISKTLPHSSRWVVGFRFRYTAPSLSTAQIYMLRNNNILLFDLLQNPDATLAIRIANGGTATTNRALFQNTHYYIEMDISLTGTTPISVTAELRINGNVEASRVASTGINASSLLSNAADANFHTFNPTSGGLGSGSWITDLYIKNSAGYESDVRERAVYPNGDGATLQWTPSTGTVHNTLVNSHPVDLTKWVSTATINNIDLWDFENCPAFTGDLLAVNISVLAQKDDEGTKSFKIVCASAAGVVEALSDEFFVSSNLAEYYEWSLALDPATGVAWTQAGFNAKQWGVKLIS